MCLHEAIERFEQGHMALVKLHDRYALLWQQQVQQRNPVLNA